MFPAELHQDGVLHQGRVCLRLMAPHVGKAAWRASSIQTQPNPLAVSRLFFLPVTHEISSNLPSISVADFPALHANFLSRLPVFFPLRIKLLENFYDINCSLVLHGTRGELQLAKLLPILFESRFKRNEDFSRVTFNLQSCIADTGR